MDKIDKLINDMRTFIRIERDTSNKVTLRAVDEMLDELKLRLIKEF